jgi:hypothetical protein
VVVAGFWMWQVKSMEEAVEWVRRAPFRDGEEIEIRAVMTPEDFGDAMPADVAAQEARLRSASAPPKP